MSNQKRIAICISGQVRTSNEKLMEISQKAREIGADVFISVWKDRGGKTIEAGTPHVTFERIFGGEMASFFPKNWVNNFKKMFPFWRDILPTYDAITESELLEIFPDAVVEIEDDRPELDLPREKNSLRMLYKIHRCNRLKKQHEKLLGYKYDLVIRVRPDMLIKFQDFANFEVDQNDLLIFLMRGDNNIAHDKYWAGNSDVDDKMAAFYDFAKENRIQKWEGIHAELTNYIQICGFNQIDFRCVISDFKIFGAYSDDEKCEIIRNFVAHMEDSRKLRPKVYSAEYEKITLDVLRNATDLICHRNPTLPNGAVIDYLEVLLNDNQQQDNGRSLLPIISLAFACNPKTPPSDRAKLALKILLNDALTWKIWLGYRTHNIVKLMPHCGAELLPLFNNIDDITDAPASEKTTARLLTLWQRHEALFDEPTLSRAKADLWHAFLQPTEIRTSLLNFFKDNNRLDEMLLFAEALAQEFPEQKNVGVILAQTQKYVAEMKRPSNFPA